MKGGARWDHDKIDLQFERIFDLPMNGSWQKIRTALLVIRRDERHAGGIGGRKKKRITGVLAKA